MGNSGRVVPRGDAEPNRSPDRKGGVAGVGGNPSLTVGARIGSLIIRRENFDVVEGGGFVAVAETFDANFISGTERDTGHDSPGRGGGVDAARGQTIGSGPLVDK